MHNNRKFLAVCAVMAAAGMILTAAGIASGGTVNGIQLNKSGLHVYAPALVKESSKGRYLEKEEELEPFDSIEINMDYADIWLETSDNGKYGIFYHVAADVDLKYEVKDGRLTAVKKDPMNYVGMDFAWIGIGRNIADVDEEYITIRMPEDAQLSAADLKSESGNIVCKGISADQMKAVTSYGDARISSARIQELDADLESGVIMIEQAAGRKYNIKSSYGDVLLDDVNLSEDMEVKVESGDLRLQDVTLRDLNLKSSYGGIDAEHTAFRTMQLSMESGDSCFTDVLFDKCSIKAEYGDVSLELTDDVKDYGYKLNAEFGSITVGGEEMGDTFSTLDWEQERTIEIGCESGNIVIN